MSPLSFLLKDFRKEACMTWLAKTEIERLKREVDLVREARSRGTQLVKSGQEYKGLCPFHEEIEASFFVNPRKNCFYCHGCGEKGSALAYIAKIDGISFREVLEKLGGDGNPQSRRL